MKKTILCAFFGALALVSCKKESTQDTLADYDKINAISHQVQVERFDKDYFESNFNDIDNLKKQYPFFFPQGIELSELMIKKNDSIWAEVYQEVKKTFPDNAKLKDVEFLFKSIKFHFPQQNVPSRLVTLVGDMEKEYSAIYTDSLAIVTLETYLGENHKYYTDFPKYLRNEYNENQIVQDMAQKFAETVVARTHDRTLIANMVQHGKIMYLKKALLPQVPENEVMCYTADQITWCNENESEMWSFLIENKLLYESDAKLDARFVNRAPFSKFYLEIDAESPGRIGVWLGWQIVRSYMQHNDVDLQTMLKTEPKEIFEKSKYKPKK